MLSGFTFLVWAYTKVLFQLTSFHTEMDIILWEKGI